MAAFDSPSIVTYVYEGPAELTVSRAPKVELEGTQEFSFGVLYSRGSGSRIPPVGPRSEAPVGGLGTVCQKLKQFAHIVYKF